MAASSSLVQSIYYIQLLNSIEDIGAQKLHSWQVNFLKETQTISIYLFYLLHNHVDTSTKSK